MTQTQPESSPLQRWLPEACLRRLWPLYCLLVLLVTFGYALWDPYQIDGDAVAYMDIGDLIGSHHWAGIVNAYWHPLYPATLALGHRLFHPTRFTELHAYYMVNFGIFALEMLAVVAFTDSIIRLRDERVASTGSTASAFILDKYTLRYLGLALLVVASQRELSLGKVRPDALLQAMLLFGLAALLRHLATARLHYAALMGLALGLAYLTKSFAFLFSLLCFAALVAFRWLWQRHSLARIAPAAALALACFAAVAGPYIAALSRQKGHFDFGDSGGLNYAWYVGGTEKFHLQNGQPQLYGSADVHLKHPNQVLMTAPLVVSYKQLPYGTYPDWFDTSFWNDQVKPHMNPGGQIHAIVRDTELTVRYLLNHPEILALFAVLLLLGARPDLCRRLSGNGFWVAPMLLGIAVWCIYGMVNIEERYVTIGFLAVVLPLVASLRPAHSAALLHATAPALVLFTALLAVGESGRIVLDLRRHIPSGYPGGWYDPETYKAAAALNDLGVGPGDTIACVGTRACVYDHYWARIAGVRILSEIYQPEPHPDASLAIIPHRDQAVEAVRREGARVLVGYFNPGAMTGTTPETAGWHELDGTPFYALPLNPATPPENTAATQPATQSGTQQKGAPRPQ
ncbi:ArnT family glycosyltransferase [Edaphobacter aggregans]|uniref:ArnT family glycosyltransferase n=1 Tax=Edaphobacter aggregans TaxID=570835 RepID=UPI00054ECDF0|nr:hypothetical protein [Edaphobacter aggregans]